MKVPDRGLRLSYIGIVGANGHEILVVGGEGEVIHPVSIFNKPLLRDRSTFQIPDDDGAIVRPRRGPSAVCGYDNGSPYLVVVPIVPCWIVC